MAKVFTDAGLLRELRTPTTQDEVKYLAPPGRARAELRRQLARLEAQGDIRRGRFHQLEVFEVVP
jgi:hypothetical protein